MELQQTKYIAIAASAVLLIALAAFVNNPVSGFREQRLEKVVAETKANADENQ